MHHSFAVPPLPNTIRCVRANIFSLLFERLPMANIRISPTEVQVGEVVYTFESAGIADDFEACVATVDVGHCETKYLAVDKRPAHPLAPDDEFPVD